MKEEPFIARAMQFLPAVLGDGFNSFVDFCEKKQGFSAEFGSESLISSRYNKGLVISKNRKLTRRKSFENILLAGQTGSGKTTRLLLKMMYELKHCSIVVNDPSKELYLLASGYLSQFFKIQTLNFSDSTESSGYNVLGRITRPSDINKVADLLVRQTIDKNASDPFWPLQSKALLSIFIRLVLYQPKEFQNMANVLHLLNHFAANPKKIDLLIVKTDAKLILDYKALIANSEKTLQNIVASSKASLQLFDDPEIARTTAFDSIDFEQLRKEPTIIFLHNSVADMKYVNTLNGIFFEQLYGHILSKLPDKELDLFVILEEASSLFVPTLPVAIANTRKHRCGNVICVQAPGFLETLYKTDAQNITANCVTKIFLPGQSNMEVLKEIETLSGKMIYKDKKEVERIRPLITIDEIRLLHEDRTLILSGNKPLIKGRTSPYYRSRKYKAFSKIVPVPLIGNIPDLPIPLIQFPEPIKKKEHEEQK